MKNIWLTADWHLDHYNIISHCDRPFKLVKEMNERILQEFHSLVKTNDDVFFLGDFCWRPILVKTLLPTLPGRWHFILGNHDEGSKNLIKKYAPQVEQVERLLITKIKGYDVTLCHYPMTRWHKSHYHAFHFHGHCHGSLTSLEPRRIDVGVDCWKFKPVHFDELKEMK